MTTWFRWAAAGLLLMAVRAGAQSRDSSDELPSVVVPLPAEEVAPESPTRRDPTGATTVIRAEERRGEASVASELIASAPGIVVHDRGGLLQTKTLTVRGASSNGVLVLLDGVPINGAGGSVDLSRIPLALVDRFEVLRGGGSLHGSGSLGGVLNVVTRRPTDGTLFTGGVTYGSFETALGNLTGSGELGGGHALLIVHGERSEGAFPYRFDPTPTLDDGVFEERRRENNDVQMAGAFARYRRPLSERLSLDASAEYAIDDRGVPGMPQNPTPQARMRSDRLTASTRLLHKRDSDELSARAWVNRDVLTYQNLYGNGVQPLLGVAVEGAGQWLLADRHVLSVAVQLGHQSLEVPARGDPSWFSGALQVSDEILFFDGDLSVVPSVRLDRAGPFTLLSPKLGAAVALPGNLQLKTNLGQAHRAPSFLELYVMQGTLQPNPNLAPERALFVDAGLAHVTEVSTLSATYFHSLYENLIAYELYAPFVARPFNINTGRVQGVEAEAALRPSAWLSLNASYTLTFSQNLRDDPRYFLRDLPYRPRHRVSGRTSFGHRRARGRLEVDYQSMQFTNRTGVGELPPRTLVNAGLSSIVWDAPEIMASLDVKNVFDVRAEDLFAQPLPGRAFYLTLSFTLDRTGDSKGDAEPRGAERT